MTSEQDRGRALKFYLKHSTGPQDKWAKTGKGAREANVVEDIVALSEQFAEVRKEAYELGVSHCYPTDIP